MQGIAEEGGAAWGEPCGRRVTGPPVDRKRSETDGEAQPARRGEPRWGEPRGGEPGETETPQSTERKGVGKTRHRLSNYQIPPVLRRFFPHLNMTCHTPDGIGGTFLSLFLSGTCALFFATFVYSL